ncbi:MAG: phosphoribosyltransferase family protein [Sphingomonadaceae bacterium]|nr:phosphoribosyltransferase family protein [Sphingomonadaceae bacterium]
MSRLLHDKQSLHTHVAGLAARISSDYADREIDLICLLNGASAFAVDLMRLITVPVRLHQLGFTSYANAPKSGEIRVTLDVAEPLEGRHVLVAEGIVVSGRTPAYVMNLLRLRQPATLEMCAIGVKPRQLAVDLQVRYAMFELGDEMAAGYGIGKGPERASPDLIDMAG